MRILSLVSRILEHEVVWIPLLLLVLNQVLKITFSLLNLLTNTLKEVALTIGAELCVVGITVHIGLLATEDSAFARTFPPNKRASAAVVLLLLYFLLTALSLLFLKLANSEMRTTVSDASRYLPHIVKTGLFIGLSFGFGTILFYLVVSTI